MVNRFLVGRRIARIHGLRRCNCKRAGKQSRLVRDPADTRDRLVTRDRLDTRFLRIASNQLEYDTEALQAVLSSIVAALSKYVFMKSSFFFHFFLFLFGFFIGNLFPTFFGQLLGALTSLVLLFFFEFIHGWTGCRITTQTSEARSVPAGLSVTSYPILGTQYLTPSNNQSVTNSRKFSIANWFRAGVVGSVSDSVSSEARIRDRTRFQIIRSVPNKTETSFLNLPSRTPPKISEAQVTAQSKNFRTLNSIKIGILFGLFVDAFKVGS